MFRFGFIILATIGLVRPAIAEPPVGDPELIFELGVGALVQPRFEGSDEFLLSPWPIFRPEYIALGPLRMGGGDRTRSFTVRPAFGIIGERDGDGDLAGLNDVDTAVELGAAVGYRYGPFRANAEVRRGVTGHDGFVGEVSVQAVLEPTDRFTVTVGPEVTLASEDYMDTYFGVSAAEAARSRFTAFDPDGGIKSVGVKATSRFTVTENWSVLGRASAHQLVGDAADSPIVERAGSKTQFTAGIGAAYRFRINLFD